MKTILSIAALAALYASQPAVAKDPAAADVKLPASASNAKDARAKAAPVKETAAERKARILEQFDANKDGKLDKAEKLAAKAAFDEEKAKRFGKETQQEDTTLDPNAFGGGGSQKSGGGLSNASPQFKQALARFDINRDGQLSPQEMQAAKQAMQTQAGQFTPEEAMRLKMGLGGRNIPPRKAAGK